MQKINKRNIPVSNEKAAKSKQKMIDSLITLNTKFEINNKKFSFPNKNLQNFFRLLTLPNIFFNNLYLIVYGSK
jgi:hypothetical protein